MIAQGPRKKRKVREGLSDFEILYESGDTGEFSQKFRFSLETFDFVVESTKPEKETLSFWRLVIGITV